MSASGALGERGFSGASLGIQRGCPQPKVGDNPALIARITDVGCEENVLYHPTKTAGVRAVKFSRISGVLERPFWS